MWFITSIYLSKPENPESPARAETKRTFGYYGDFAYARKAVEENRSNMHECLYNYLVIEKFNEGVHALAESEDWYQWDETKNGWKSIPKPSFSEGLVNWAIG